MLRTMRRETAEESGITKMALIPGFERRLRWSFRDSGMLVRKVCVYRLARTSQRRLRVSREHRSARWLGYRAAVAVLEFGNARRLLAAAETYLVRRGGGRAR